MGLCSWESGYWLGVALDDFQSATGHAVASCPLLPELHVTLGKALLRKAGVSGVKSGDAAANFIKALTIKPDYIPAYYALSDYYAELGDKKQALSVIEDGLRHVPNSKGLLRRFKELGGTTPPAPVAITSDSKATEVAKDRPVEEQKVPLKNTITQPAAGAASSKQNAPAEESNKPKIGSPSNPWCRFCPPEE